jgi:hypothetical protein
MGDNFLKQQIRNFEKSTDLAMDTLERAKLFRRLENFKTTYRAKQLGEESFKAGETLFATVPRNGPGIVLSRGHKRIGEIAGKGGDALTEVMREFASILTVKVVSVSDVSGSAAIEVLKE